MRRSGRRGRAGQVPVDQHQVGGVHVQMLARTHENGLDARPPLVSERPERPRRRGPVGLGGHDRGCVDRRAVARLRPRALAAGELAVRSEQLGAVVRPLEALSR
jgi:hypothetical protein